MKAIFKILLVLAVLSGFRVMAAPTAFRPSFGDRSASGSNQLPPQVHDKYFFRAPTSEYYETSIEKAKEISIGKYKKFNKELFEDDVRNYFETAGFENDIVSLKHYLRKARNDKERVYFRPLNFPPVPSRTLQEFWDDFVINYNKVLDELEIPASAAGAAARNVRP
ncbi:hypothetical protein BCV70DRAFT_197202 [Testicularia cyperi]|uniref:Uncharacterized protein n=1 Tax=Testicularia cyperi TaxID=1882483 RepID=A0A317Y009_9BASI|nr:hypothetical protein BCV70DRAFT_197202 [Testicularia cyperi]